MAELLSGHDSRYTYYVWAKPLDVARKKDIKYFKLTDHDRAFFLWKSLRKNCIISVLHRTLRLAVDGMGFRALCYPLRDITCGQNMCVACRHCNTLKRGGFMPNFTQISSQSLTDVPQPENSPIIAIFLGSLGHNALKQVRVSAKPLMISWCSIHI